MSGQASALVSEVSKSLEKFFDESGQIRKKLLDVERGVRDMYIYRGSRERRYPTETTPCDTQLDKVVSRAKRGQEALEKCQMGSAGSCREAVQHMLAAQEALGVADRCAKKYAAERRGAPEPGTVRDEQGNWDSRQKVKPRRRRRR